MNRYIRRPELISASLDDDLVMLDIELGKYFSLNPVAARIWELLEEAQTAESLCILLQEEYEVTEDQCLSETSRLLEEMVSIKLLTRL